MPELTDKIIGKVYEGTSGSNKRGPWTSYSFYLEGGELKFRCFKSGSNPAPVEGARVISMTYATQEKDGYTNHNVSKLVLGERVQPQQNSSPGEQKRYVDNGKVIIDLMGMAKPDFNNLPQLVDVFKAALVQLMSPLPALEAPKDDGPPDNLGDPGYDFSMIPDSEIPF